MPAQDVTVTANFEPAEFDGGTGTAEDPYQIADWHQLDYVRNYLDSYFILVGNLGRTTPGYAGLASATAHQGAGWQPIGTEGGWFTGSFDGHEYEIHDLFINRPGEDLVGVFGYVDEEGVIANMGVVNATVTGNFGVGSLVADSVGNVANCYAIGTVTGGQFVGGLIGANGGDVSNCHFAGSVTGTGTAEPYGSTVGGLVGVNTGGTGTVSNLYSTGSVTGYGNSVGGLVGVSGGATVSNCYSTSSVTGYGLAVGGLVGSAGAGNVTESYATGDAAGTSYVGGLLGGNGYNGVVSKCYATGGVTGNDNVGGLVGYNGGGTGTVSNSYSIGTVTGTEPVGGLVGDNSGNVSGSFWDTETSGQSTSAGGTGKTTAQMKSITTFSGAGWSIIGVASPSTRNITYIWNIVDGATYPFLSWQAVS
jgi:hypothetical protein